MTALEDPALNKRSVKAPYPTYVALFNRGQTTTPTSGICTYRMSSLLTAKYTELLKSYPYISYLIVDAVIDDFRINTMVIVNIPRLWEESTDPLI